MARAEEPGLVLLDLHLPDMPGVEVLRGLRNDPTTAAIPVVVVSADATPGQMTELRASGAADYVTKPFEVPRLLAVIDSFAGVPG
jgi:CheY-like chemotaxis protein